MTQEEYRNPSYKRPDHPSFQEKRHTLLIDSQGASNKEIQTESGTLRFEDGVAVLPDDTRGKDIYDEIKHTHALHPNQYALVEKKPTVNPDPIHRYTFGYSQKFAERWNTIFADSGDQEHKEEQDGREGPDDHTERGATVIQSET